MPGMVLLITSYMSTFVVSLDLDKLCSLATRYQGLTRYTIAVWYEGTQSKGNSHSREYVPLEKMIFMISFILTVKDNYDIFYIQHGDGATEQEITARTVAKR
jgi:hypothetical protein